MYASGECTLLYFANPKPGRTNVHRMDYAAYLGSGLQIGSGPMESFHTTGSQCRLKIPGARWLEHTSQAILRLRMLQLSGRWEEFWSQPDLDAKLAPAFSKRAAERRQERKVRVQRQAEARQAAIGKGVQSSQ